MAFKINCNVSYLLYIIASVIAFEDEHLMALTQQNMGFSANILCRNCGRDVTTTGTLISKSSPKSRFSFNDTVFYKDDVLVQVFATDFFFHYPLISFTYSTCVPTGEWEESTSWFPGYLWKPCICPDCGAYIGFVFEPVNPSMVEPTQTFYGLLLTSLISENCKYNRYLRLFGVDLWVNLFCVSRPFAYCLLYITKPCCIVWTIETRVFSVHKVNWCVYSHLQFIKYVSWYAYCNGNFIIRVCGLIITAALVDLSGFRSSPSCRGWSVDG